jgi:hypothetical protein
VTAAPPDDKLEFVYGGHKRARIYADRSYREVVPDMESDGGSNFRVVKDAVVNHSNRAVASLFGGLKGELYIAGQRVALGHQLFCDRKPYRYMRVVTAGVHHSVVLRAIIGVALFLHGQRVHVCPVEQGAGGRVAFAEQPDYACAANARLYIVTVLSEPLGNRARGNLLVIAKLGVAVKTAAV